MFFFDFEIISFFLIVFDFDSESKLSRKIEKRLIEVFEIFFAI